MKKGLFTVAALALALFVVFCSTTRPVVRATGIVGSKNGKLLASTPYRLLYGGYTRERLHGQTDGQTNDKRTDLRRFLTEYLQ